MLHTLHTESQIGASVKMFLVTSDMGLKALRRDLSQNQQCVAIRLQSISPNYSLNEVMTLIFHDKLSRLELFHGVIRDEDWEKVSDRILNQPELAALYLREKRFSSRCYSLLYRSEVSKSLTELRLRYLTLDVRTVKLLGKALRQNASLESLTFRRVNSPSPNYLAPVIMETYRLKNLWCGAQEFKGLELVSLCIVVARTRSLREIFVEIASSTYDTRIDQEVYVKRLMANRERTTSMTKFRPPHWYDNKILETLRFV